MFEPREFLFALPWLHTMLGLGEEVNLYYLIAGIRAGYGSQNYKVWRKGERVIHEPTGELKEVQQGIARFILRKFSHHPASSGFMGGSCKQAASVHLGFGSVLTFDLRSAFSQITHWEVMNALHRKHPTKNYLSYYAARLVADLCTCGEVEWVDSRAEREWCSVGGFLPQGPCTSPKLFELCLRPLDDKLVDWAQMWGVKYSRYADNLFFSAPEQEFPALTRAKILSEVGKKYKYHKLRQTSRGELCRMLGLNVSPDALSNTRAFKRAFRKALHHLEYVLENDVDYAEAWATVRGYWGFSIPDTLPVSLKECYSRLERQVKTRHQAGQLW